MTQSRQRKLDPKYHSMSVYLPVDIKEAMVAYRNAGHTITLSRVVQQTLVERFISIEKGRRAIGEPFLYTPAQLANMKFKLEDDE